MIRIEDVSFRYREDEEQVLKHIDLQIHEGEFVAILGHNGCGKSTLARHLNAVLLPQTGSVLVDGMDTANEDQLLNIRSCVGMVFQNPDNQIVSSVVEEDVAFALENLGVDPDEIVRRVNWALESTEMSAFYRNSTYQLSGGQKQRVAIAGTLAMQPKYIVLDEPTAMLDPRGRKLIMTTLKNINRNLHIAVVLITHYMEEAAMADRVIVMDSGKVLLDGPPREVFAQKDTLKAVGLSVPQSSELAMLLMEHGAVFNQLPLNEKEFVQQFEEYNWKPLKQSI